MRSAWARSCIAGSKIQATFLLALPRGAPASAGIAVLNQRVQGSNPCTPSKFFKHLAQA
jgi:hypothetical protein